MIRYFFHLHECGPVLLDREGLELADLDAVKAQAYRSARAIMSAEVEEGRLCLDCRIEVEDADRRPVMTVPFRTAIALSGGR